MKKRVPKKPARGTSSRQAPVEPAFLPIVKAFAGERDVTRKRMFSSSSVLSVKGKIFAMFVKGRFVAKLPRDRVDEIVAGGFGTHFDPGHGRLMKEWVSVDAEGPPWLGLAREAHRFVKTGKG
jgi:hypothetical protein